MTRVRVEPANSSISSLQLVGSGRCDKITVRPKTMKNRMAQKVRRLRGRLMTENEARLLQLLKDRSFKRGTFRLASGGVSDYFIDGKMTEVYSEAVPLIGEVLYERTKDLDIDAIGGLESGAIPLTTAVVFSY